MHQFSDKTDKFQYLRINSPTNSILESQFQKSKSGFGISILKILCTAILRQNGELRIFGLKFAQKWILGLEFQKCKSGFRSSVIEILCTAIFRQNWQLSILDINLPQKRLCWQNFKNLSLALESQFYRY